MEENIEQVAEEVQEPVVEETTVEVVEAPVKEIPVKTVEKKPVKTAPVAAAPVAPVGQVDAMSLWVTELTTWCRSKGMQCITTADEADVYLHVYFPHKKDVFTVGKWCFRADMGGAALAAEMTRLFAYCEGFADCFEKLMK